MKREDARKVYETAKSEGKTASLLDQQRPNIFTQAVANIMPGEDRDQLLRNIGTITFEGFKWDLTGFDKFNMFKK